MLESHQEFDVVILTGVGSWNFGSPVSGLPLEPAESAPLSSGPTGTAVIKSSHTQEGPTEHKPKRLAGWETFGFFRPLGPYRIRTFLEENDYSCKVIDYITRYTIPQLEDIVNKFVSSKTLYVGLSTTYIDNAHELGPIDSVFERLKTKYPNLKVVLAGQKASNYDILKSVDQVIDGYGEVAFLKMLNGDQSRNINGNHLPQSEDYNVTWIKDDMLHPNDPLPLETARGCIFKCAFCSYPLNGKKKLDYLRGEESIKNELIYNYENFGTEHYIFSDDTFNDSVAKLERMLKISKELPFDLKYTTFVKPELLDAMPEQIDLLTESGMIGCFVGIESYNPQTRKSVFKGNLEKIKKSLWRLKNERKYEEFTIAGGMIVGLPYEDAEMAVKNFEDALEEGLVDHHQYLPLHILDKNGKNKNSALSPIDMDPKKFGYLVSKMSNFTHNEEDDWTNNLYWVNKSNGMDLTKATKISNQINKRTMIDTRCNLAAFSKMNLRYYGITDSIIKVSELQDKRKDMLKCMNETVDAYYRYHMSI